MWHPWRKDPSSFNNFAPRNMHTVLNNTGEEQREDTQCSRPGSKRRKKSGKPSSARWPGRSWGRQLGLIFIQEKILLHPHPETGIPLPHPGSWSSKPVLTGPWPFKVLTSLLLPSLHPGPAPLAFPEVLSLFSNALFMSLVKTRLTGLPDLTKGLYHGDY